MFSHGFQLDSWQNTGNAERREDPQCVTKAREVFKLLSLQFVRHRKPDQSGGMHGFSTTERN